MLRNLKQVSHRLHIPDLVHKKYSFYRVDWVSLYKVKHGRRHKVAVV